MDRHLDFSRSTDTHTRAQTVTGYLFPSPNCRLDFYTSTIARGFLQPEAFCQAMRPFSAMCWR
jgi:hypothetical protein